MSWHADIFVPGYPKGRPRISTPGTAEAWKGQIALAFGDILPPEPLTGPVRLWIEAFLPRPKRLCRKMDPDGPILCTSTPDWDNLGKAVSDALEQIGVFVNDKQVVDGRVRCCYHAKGGRPGARIRVNCVRGS